jgi:hypothetical protein
MAKDGSVPEGQAIVTSNLAECYEILQVSFLQVASVHQLICCLQILREEIEDGD